MGCIIDNNSWMNLFQLFQIFNLPQIINNNMLPVALIFEAFFVNVYTIYVNSA